MTESHIKWFFFNVILSLLPLFLNIILIKVGQIKTNWIEILNGGELFFFASAISSSSLGGLLFLKPSNISLGLVISYLLMITITISTGMFALSSFLKLKQLDILDNKLFSKTSVWCSLLAIFLSYGAFLISK
jgi:hypothetical protein